MFDENVVSTLLNKVGLAPAGQARVVAVQQRLNEIADEYYWEELNQPSRDLNSSYSIYDSVASGFVTPSGLTKRLIRIERAAKRVQAAKSRHPLRTRIVVLLGRLGYDTQGKPKDSSGTDKTGHGGSGRSALRLCLVRAVLALEQPPKGYRPTFEIPSWASPRLRAEIDSLAAFDDGREETRAPALDAAKTIRSWAEYANERLTPLINSNPDRHRGQTALDSAILKLADLYREVSGKGPSLSQKIGHEFENIPNTWERFLHGVLEIILAPGHVPSISALHARWHRLAYTDRKNRI